MQDTTPPNSLLSLKTVIRTKNFDASKAFYTQILNLQAVEEYKDEDGSKGLILRLGSEGSTAFLEISAIMDSQDYYQEAFSHAIQNDKIDLQIRTSDLEYWVSRLKDKWSARGPMLRPWGSQYLYLRDPDGLQIIIYQEKA